MPQETSKESNIDPLELGNLLTLPQAAQISGLSHAYLKDIAKSGRLRAKKVGRDWLTTLAAIEEYKNTRHRGKRTDLDKPTSER